MAYVLSGLVFQYIVPLCIVTMAYIMVARAFRISTERMLAGSLSCRMMRKISRRKRTDILLTLISLLFFLSWAPLNVLNVVINTANPFKVTSKLFATLLNKNL